MLNMFTGVVVENFSYVFQSTGGAKSITRREMRSFKRIWAEFSNTKTGQLDRQKIAPFLSVSFYYRYTVRSYMIIIEAPWSLRGTYLPSGVLDRSYLGRLSG